MLGNFYTQGEICTNCTRVFVHHTIKNAFVKQLLHRTAKLKLGDPTNPQTQVGSLINRDHQQKVLACIEKAKLAGAKLLIGGGVPDDAQLANGAFVEPTIFDECQDDMPNVKEEIFGPVLSLLSFAEEDEVIHGQTTLPTDWRRAFLPKTLSEPTESSPAYKRNLLD